MCYSYVCNYCVMTERSEWHIDSLSGGILFTNHFLSTTGHSCDVCAQMDTPSTFQLVLASDAHRHVMIFRYGRVHHIGKVMCTSCSTMEMNYAALDFWFCPLCHPVKRPHKRRWTHEWHKGSIVVINGHDVICSTQLQWFSFSRL